MSTLAFLAGVLVCCGAFAQGYYFGRRASRSEAMKVEACCLSLLQGRTEQIRAGQKGISRMHRKIGRLNADVDNLRSENDLLHKALLQYGPPKE